MDIQETNKLNKTEQLIDNSYIRTMSKDIDALGGKRSIAVPPAGLPVLPTTPPKPPISLKFKPKIPEIKIVKKQGKPTFVFLALAVVIIIGGIGGFFYWWNYVRSLPPVATHFECQENQCLSVEGEGDNQCQTDVDCQPVITEPDEPSSFIPVSATETIELIVGQEGLLIGQLKSLSAQEQENDTFKRILVKLTDQTEIKYADLNTLMIALGINIPEPIISVIASSSVETDNYTLFFYNQPEGNRLGLIIKIEGSETLVQDLRDWEITALNDIKSMLLMDEIPVGATEGFQDNIHKDVFIRYMNFATPDLSLDYGLVAGNLVLSTSRESMFATIDILSSE